MILYVMCLIIGIGGMTVSFYYSLQWFIQRGIPLWVSIIFAFIYVAFANITFEYGIEALNKVKNVKTKLIGISEKASSYEILKARKKRLLTSGILIMLSWSLLSAYSMICTVGGQYDQLMDIESVSVETIDIPVDNTKVIELKESSLSAYEEERDILLASIASIESMEDRWEYKNTTTKAEARLDTVRTEIDKLSTDLEVLYLAHSEFEYIDSFDVTTRGFFVYVSELVNGKWNPVKIQFYLALFPSVVTDIISPVCLTIFVIGIRRKKALSK